MKPATWATLSDQQQEFFYMYHPTDMTVYTIAFVTPSRGALAGMRNSSMGPPSRIDLIPVKPQALN